MVSSQMMGRSGGPVRKENRPRTSLSAVVPLMARQAETIAFRSVDIPQTAARHATPSRRSSRSARHSKRGVILVIPKRRTRRNTQKFGVMQQGTGGRCCLATLNRREGPCSRWAARVTRTSSQMNLLTAKVAVAAAPSSSRTSRKGGAKEAGARSVSVVVHLTAKNARATTPLLMVSSQMMGRSGGPVRKENRPRTSLSAVTAMMAAITMATPNITHTAK